MGNSHIVNVEALMQPAVFLDRDGTLNHLVFHQKLDFWGPPFRPEQLELFKGVGESLRSLSAAGYELFVTTNQPDHAKGKTTLENILAVRDAFEEKLRQLGVTLTDSYYCLCHPDGTTPGYGAPCACYKPSSHMVEKLAAAHNIDIGTSWMVGDRDGDMICGKGAGLRTIRLPDANPEAAAGEGEKGDYQATDIVEATAIILQRHDERIVDGN